MHTVTHGCRGKGGVAVWVRAGKTFAVQGMLPALGQVGGPRPDTEWQAGTHEALSGRAARGMAHGKSPSGCL